MATGLPEGFYSGEIYCYRYGSSKDATFGYIPGKPRIESKDDGKPIASLLASPVAGVLALQTVWSGTAGSIEAALDEIHKRYPKVKRPDLKIAELSSATASFIIAGDDGASFTFPPQPTSGSASYRVAFSETIKTTEKRAVLNAFRGHDGVIKVTYDGTLELRETISTVAAGDLADELKALAPKKVEKKSGGFFGRSKEERAPAPLLPDMAACAGGIDRALASGKLQVANDETPNVSEEMRTRVESGLKANLAKMLCDKIRELGEDAVYMSSFSVNLTASDSDTVRFHITQAADLGSCFAGDSGVGLVTEAASPLSDPLR